MNGTIGLLANVQIHVELEPEQIPERSRWLKQTVELALDNLLGLKNVIRSHAPVRLSLIHISEPTRPY